MASFVIVPFHHRCETIPTKKDVKHTSGPTDRSPPELSQRNTTEEMGSIA